MRLILERRTLVSATRCQSLALSVVLSAACSILAAPVVVAGLAPYSVKTDLRYDTAVETHSNEVSMSRLTLLPQAQWRLGKSWRGELSFRLEWADDDTGLGTINNYATHSRPWIKSNRARVELEKAKLVWRGGKHRLTLGKQVAAWGVLDGIRITDRFDPVRQRDFIFTDTRPERIARWGVQTQTRMGAWRLDTAIALDPTVSQQANLGDSFSPLASRFTQGLALEGSSAIVRTEPRNQIFRDATIGIRISRELGTGSISLVTFNGPAADPILHLDRIGNTPRVTLRYPKRSLVGISWDRPLGNTILRGEAAYIPDQPVNVLAESQLTSTRRNRWLGGLGLDWNAPFNLFVNAQLGVDHLADGRAELTRPQTDVIATLRVQRSFSQSGWTLKCEWLGSLSDGDSVVRPAVVRELNDSISLTLGADLAFGDTSGQFGQFHDRSRGWARLQISW